jgi:KUP system potassium uptake protein
METFLLSYEQIYAKGKNIPGTGLFFTRETPIVPPYVVHCIIRSNIIYERNVFISIIRSDEPFGLKSHLKTGIGPGLDAFEVNAGYMEVIDIEKLLKKHDVQEKVIFYGVEDISTNNPVWRVFSAIKKLTPNFVQFNKLPASKLQGVVTRVEM